MTSAYNDPVVCVAAPNIVGRLDFVKACYKCLGCGDQQWQLWQDYLQLGFCPKGLHLNNENFVEMSALECIRW